jgi:hypothetical protein
MKKAFKPKKALIEGGDLVKIIDQTMLMTEVQSLSFCLSLLGSGATTETVVTTIKGRLKELAINNASGKVEL